MSRELKVLNLRLRQNESGLMTTREQVTQAVIQTHAEFGQVDMGNEKHWANSLFEILKQRVTG